MPPRRRQQFTQDNIDQQLQQIHLLDPSSSSENLEQLGPIIKQIHTNRQQDAYLRTVLGLIDSKDAEIEKICSDNYQDFISSVSTLFTVKSYTDKMKENISSLDASVAQLGGSLVEKKRALLQSRKTAANLDEAIDTLQACLRVLDVVDRVGEMIKAGKYWSALRSLEDIQSMPPTSLSQTPFFQHLLSSLPSLRGQIKGAVTASMKQWLLEIRNISTESRTKRWRSRREKDPLLRVNRVGSAVELVTYEKIDELRKSYQADRKAQSDLILPTPLPLASIASLTQEISGFFIVESHLWDALVTRLATAIEDALRKETNPEVFLKVKESLLSFIMTLETYSYTTTSLQSFIVVLFEKYAKLLETQFTKRFETIVREDEITPMKVDSELGIDGILEVVWISDNERNELKQTPVTYPLPWSQTFFLCCQDIRIFIQRFYAFVEGVSQHHRDIDELLSKSLDSLLTKSISGPIGQRLATTQNPTQIAQIITNLEHLQVTCGELERSLTNLRSTHRGGTIRLTASAALDATISRSCARMSGLINSKLDQCFEFMYLYELVNWLTTVVDSLVIKETYKEEAYKGALAYITECLMDFLTGRDIPIMNENAISNILIDVDFLEDELRRIGRSHLSSVFTELRLTTSIALGGTVQEYLVPANRHASYATVKPKRLQSLLEKLARFGATQRDAASRELGEKRRKEAEAVGRVFPGENR
ncbi:rsec15 [Gymnopilus junonius]|uniref:Exocyst complex component SEC15 n=1 Tax=Gymnopilus junonius TaxID=109634 RepID=A0A9P5P4F5_GYMJU|nr:rsec15 [Gymnopilus junonius]